MKPDINYLKRVAEKYKRLYSKRIKIRDFYGISPPSVIISSKYPTTYLGVLVSEDNGIFNPTSFKTVYDVLRYRLKFVNLFKKVRADLPRKPDRFYEEVVDGAIALNEVEYEARLKKLGVRLQGFNKAGSMIYGKVSYLKVISNPKIPRDIYYVMDDVKATDALLFLYNKGYPDDYLSRILSLGILGLRQNKKIVPSKWAITAVHKIISSYLEKNLKYFKKFDGYLLAKSCYLGNCIYVILAPDDYSFKYYEIFMPGSAYNKGPTVVWGEDRESGGFYAVKLSVLEKLNDIERYGRVLVIRVVTKDYSLPLGVWVLRKATTQAFNNISFYDSSKELVRALFKIFLTRYNFNIYKILRHSKFFVKNKKLFEFFR